MAVLHGSCITSEIQLTLVQALVEDGVFWESDSFEINIDKRAFN